SVPPYIRCAHQSAPLHQVSPSHCHLISGIPVRVPPYTQSTPFYYFSQSECPFTSYSTSECPFPSHVPIRVPLSKVCAHLCSFNIKSAHRSSP
ncbi:unnamed protein product, partial [Staurois parvus]